MRTFVSVPVDANGETVYHLRESLEERLTPILCQMQGTMRMGRDGGVLHCWQCHEIAATVGRNRQKRAFDLSDAECSEPSEDS